MYLPSVEYLANSEIWQAMTSLARSSDVPGRRYFADNHPSSSRPAAPTGNRARIC